MTHKEEAELSRRLFDTYRASRRKWIDERIEEYQFAMGQMWNATEVEELKKRNQVDYVWNRMYPYLRHYESLLTSRTPEAQLIPAGDVDNDLVLVMNDVLKYILHISYWPQQFRRAIKSMLMKGMGWMWIYADPFSSGGSGDVKVEYVNIQDVYVPENACGVLFDDAESIILSRVIPLPEAQMLYPNVKSTLESEAFEGLDDTEHDTTMTGEKERSDALGPQTTSGSPEFKNVRIIHRYTKERKRIWKLFNQATDEEIEVEKEPVLVNSDFPAEGEYSSREWWSAAYIVTRIREVTSAGTNIWIGERALPLEDWPLVPFMYSDDENPYPISAVTLHKGQQKLLNRFASLSLECIKHNIGPKVIAKKGAIDKGVWSDEFSLPNSINEINYEMSDIQIIQTSPVPSSMFTMMEEIKQEISFETASAPFHQGSSQGIPPTLGQTQTLQEESTRRMAPVIQQVDVSIQRMYEVMLQMVPVVYTDYRLLTIIDKDSFSVKNVEINKPKYDEQTAEVLEVINDIKKFRARVMVRTGSSIEPSRVANLLLFTQLAQQFPQLTKYVFRYMNITNSQQLEQEFDENIQLRQALQSSEQQMKELEQIIDRLQTTVQDKDEKIELEKVRARLNKVLVMAEANAKIQLAQQKQTPQKQ